MDALLIFLIALIVLIVFDFTPTLKSRISGLSSSPLWAFRNQVKFKLESQDRRHQPLPAVKEGGRTYDWTRSDPPARKSAC
jgi:hypothetical protein